MVVNAVDVHWQDHLTEMEELRRSVGLRGYGQKDPLSEYKSEAFRAFEEMMGAMRSEVCTGMFRAATNLAAFENMLSTLSKSAKSTGLIPAVLQVLIAFPHLHHRHLKSMSLLHLRRLPQLCGMPQKWDGMIRAPAEAEKKIQEVLWRGSCRLVFSFLISL